MNRIETNLTGGFPLNTDDIRWIYEQGTKDAFKGLLSGVGINFKLSGAEVTQSGVSWDISPGYLVLDGEVLEVEAHQTTLVVGQTYYFVLEEQAEPEGYVRFGDLIYRDTYFKRTAVLVGSTTPPAGYLGKDGVDLKTLINYNVGDVWVSEIPIVDVPGTYTPTGVNEISWLKVGKTFHFNLRIKGLLSATPAVISIEIPNGEINKSNFRVLSILNGTTDILTCSSVPGLNQITIGKANLTTFTGEIDISFGGTFEIN